MSILMFVLEHDLSRPSKDIAIDLIYQTNQYAIRRDHVTFGKPLEMDITPFIDDDPNTFVPVDIKRAEDARMRGDDGFLYRRLPLSLLVQDPTFIIRTQQLPFKVHDFIDQINEQLQAQLTVDDVVNDEFTSIDGPFILRASPHSLAWIGTTELTVDATDDRPRLVKEPFLAGFKIYQPQP